MPTNLGLWSRISEFTLDDPQAQFQFTDRLARENGWSRNFARRAVEEYKKFVYLAAISKTPVTPSDIVDQVWHLHLTFTQSYWGELCGKVLGKSLHHGPTKGGADEDARYREQYGDTLILYDREFGAPAPTRLWPYAEERFSGAEHQRWVDRRTHIIVPKLSLRPVWGLLSASGIAAMTVAASAATTAQRGAGAGRGLALLAIAGVVAIVIAAAASASPKKKGKNGGGGSCGGYVGGNNCGDGNSGGDCGGSDGGGGGCSGGGCGGGGSGS